MVIDQPLILYRISERFPHPVAQVLLHDAVAGSGNEDAGLPKTGNAGFRETADPQVVIVAGG